MLIFPHQDIVVSLWLAKKQTAAHFRDFARLWIFKWLLRNPNNFKLIPLRIKILLFSQGYIQWILNKTMRYVSCVGWDSMIKHLGAYPAYHLFRHNLSLTKNIIWSASSKYILVLKNILCIISSFTLPDQWKKPNIRRMSNSNTYSKE